MEPARSRADVGANRAKAPIHRSATVAEVGFIGVINLNRLRPPGANWQRVIPALIALKLCIVGTEVAHNVRVVERLKRAGGNRDLAEPSSAPLPFLQPRARKIDPIDGSAWSAVREPGEGVADDRGKDKLVL